LEAVLLIVLSWEMVRYNAPVFAKWCAIAHWFLRNDADVALTEF
jgi:hypothetical protein